MRKLRREAQAVPSMNFLMFTVSWMFVGVIVSLGVIAYANSLDVIDLSFTFP